MTLMMGDHQVVEKTLSGQFDAIIQELQSGKLSKSREEEQLTKLKVLSRDKTIDFNFVSPNYIDILINFSTDGRLEAQRCISNLLINYDCVRDSFILPYIRCAKVHIKQYNDTKLNNQCDWLIEAMYFDMRIISLLSGLCPTSRKIFADLLIDDMWNILHSESRKLTTFNKPLINELLKSLFNLTLDDSNKPKDSAIIKSVITRLFPTAICDLDSNNVSEDKQDLLIDNLIHLLTNIKDNVYEDLEVKDCYKLLDYLNCRLKPVLGLTELALLVPLINVCSTACKFNECIRKSYYERIFSSSIDFKKRPEEYDDLRGRLVKHMTHIDLMIKDAVSEFLFCVCNKNVETFITYTGFGNSAAFLSTNGLLSNARNINNMDDSRDQLTKAVKNMNPITGMVEATKPNPIDLMTDEEKESSAIELAEAISRLSKLGVVKPARIGADGRISDFGPIPSDDSSKKL